MAANNGDLFFAFLCWTSTDYGVQKLDTVKLIHGGRNNISSLSYLELAKSRAIIGLCPQDPSEDKQTLRYHLTLETSLAPSSGSCWRGVFQDQPS